METKITEDSCGAADGGPKYRIIRECARKVKCADGSVAEVYRIQALRGFGGITAGEPGGWVGSAACLSHEGLCWIGNGAAVYGDARVTGGAVVGGHAQVYGSAAVTDDAIVGGHAQVYGEAVICGNAIVGGAADVSGQALIGGHASVKGSVRITGRVKLGGYTQVGFSGTVEGAAESAEEGRRDVP